MATASTRHKEFGVIKIDDVEPLTFSLGGEEFECRRAVQGSELLTFVRETDVEDDAAAAGAVIDFVKSSVVEEDRERFNEMLESDDIVIPLDTLAEIGRWLLETYSARPTPPPSRSSSGRKKTASSSKAEES